jgi:hypothetical protein
LGRFGRKCVPAAEAVIDCLGRIAVPGETGALFAQPCLQLDDERTATFLAHTQPLLRTKTVDLTLDGEQEVDALDRLGCDRCLGEPCQIKELAPAVRPARGLDDRATFAIGLVKPAEARIGVGLHQPGIARQMLLRMFTTTIRRVEEHGRRRIWASKRAVVAHIGPEPAGPGLALGQDRHRGVVGVDAFGRKDMASDRLDQWHQGSRGGTPRAPMKTPPKKAAAEKAAKKTAKKSAKKSTAKKSKRAAKHSPASAGRKIVGKKKVAKKKKAKKSRR